MNANANRSEADFLRETVQRLSLYEGLTKLRPEKFEMTSVERNIFEGLAIKDDKDEDKEKDSDEDKDDEDDDDEADEEKAEELKAAADY